MIRFLTNSIGKKIYSIIFLFILSTIAIIWMQASAERTALLKEKEAELRNLISIAHTVVEEEFQRVQSGTVTDHDARVSAAERIAKLRYGNGDYFWINDFDAQIVMHAAKPELNGRDGSSIKDPDGTAVFRAFAEIGRKSGNGYLYYKWPKPGAERSQPKLSYVATFAPWGWVIGTGIYIDDIDAQFAAELTHLAVIVAPLMLVTLMIAVFVTRRISRAITTMTQVMRRLADGDLRTVLPTLHGRDELSSMAHVIEIFRAAMIEAEHLRREQAETQMRNDLERQALNRKLADRMRQTVGVIVEGLNSLSRSASEATDVVERNAAFSSSRIGVALSRLETATADVASVASSVQELSSSIGEISSQAVRTTHAVQTAAETGTHARQITVALQRATQNIGEISGLVDFRRELTRDFH